MHGAGDYGLHQQMPQAEPVEIYMLSKADVLHLAQHIECESEILVHNHRMLYLCTFGNRERPYKKMRNNYLKEKNVCARIDSKHRHF